MTHTIRLVRFILILASFHHRANKGNGILLCMARQIKRASQKVGGLARYTDQRLNCGSAEALTHAVTGFLTPETRF